MQAGSIGGSPGFVRDGSYATGAYATPSNIRLADGETMHTLPSGAQRQGERITLSDRERQQYEFSQFRPSVTPSVTDSMRRSGDYDVGKYHSVQAHYRQSPEPTRYSPSRYRENPRWSGEGEYIGSGDRKGKSPTRAAFSRPLEAAVPESELVNNDYWENLTKYDPLVSLQGAVVWL